MENNLPKSQGPRYPVETGLLDNDGVPINTARIHRVLFNFYPNFNWPFTNASFTVYRFGRPGPASVHHHSVRC